MTTFNGTTNPKPTLSIFPTGAILFHPSTYKPQVPNSPLKRSPPSPAVLFNGGAIRYRPLCLASDCPVKGTHYSGLYLHGGRKRANAEFFGESNPPPKVWEALERMMEIKRMVGIEGIVGNKEVEREFSEQVELVMNFLKFHCTGWAGFE